MKSIQHLVATDIVIKFTVDYRKSQKVLNAFCKPILKTGEDSTPLGVPNLDGLFSVPGMVQEKETIDPVDPVEIESSDDDSEDETEDVNVSASNPADLFPVRTQIKVSRTATRRLADFLLTVPVRTPLGRRIRAGFKCPPSQLYGSWDLSQIESRIAMHLSQDPLGLKFFRELNPRTGERYDIHKETAAYIYFVTVSEVTKEQRDSAKTINYGIIYGLSPEGLQDQLRMIGIDRTLDECAELIANVLGVFTGLSKWMQSVILECRAQGWVADASGMIRYLPGIWSKDQSIRSECERVAISQKVQGLAQHMIQQEMRKLRRDIWEMQQAGYKVWWCRLIHDEIVLRFQEDLWPVLNMIVIDALINHSGVEMSVPIESSGHYADNWGDLK
jgi:DNA polymerase-1